MQAYGPMRKRGFTLVELLTVVAIIALLIGLLVPAIGKVRDHAKRASVENLLGAIGKGCEAFHANFERYPRSTALNPFEAASANVWLSGAQWLVLELAGADLKGYVAMDKDRYFNTVNPQTTGVNEEDWRDWYALTPSNANLRRWGPYVELEGKLAVTPERYETEKGYALPDLLKAGTSDFSNKKLPMVVDAFGFPVLYYAANPHAKQPFTEWTGTTTVKTVGRYSQRDNEAFTGSKEGDAPGYDLGSGEVKSGQYHWLYDLGWSATDASKRPDAQTFAEKFYDRGLFEQHGGATGKVWPYRPDTFLLISAGKDGIFGTSDDVTNF